MFANLAFGGKFYVGSPYGDIDMALTPCSYSISDLALEKSLIFLASSVTCVGTCFPTIYFPPVFIVCYALCLRGTDILNNAALNTFIKDKPHGVAGSNDFIGEMMRNHYTAASQNLSDLWAVPALVAGNGIYHNEKGYNSFEGWPKWNDFSHQKAHIDFLRRAYEGGMRLMVMLAVENSVLAEKLTIEGVDMTGYNEMNGIRMQIEDAKKMEQFIATKQGGWLKIVYTAEEAENAIRDGKFAMVLGTENGLFLDNPTDFSVVAKNLFDLYNLGVRHVFTIHEDDNNFGGAAYFATRKQDPDGFLKGICNIQNLEPAPEFSTNTTTNGQRNAKGLTPQGVFLQQSLMSLGMIYEIDHMSEKTKNSTLQLAEQAKYPGLSASHCGFTEVNALHQLHEGQLKPDQLRRLDNLGGVIGLILGQAFYKGDVKQYGNPARVSYTCGGSSETFAQAYSYALDSFSFPNGKNRGIAFGCDIIPIPLIGPRFGPEGCSGTGTNIKSRLTYPFVSLFDNHTMDKSVVGNRTYDFNTDGMAHIGMYPDFIAELQIIGFTPQDIEPIYHSAEEYIKTWKKAEATNINEYVNFLIMPSNPDVYFKDVSDPHGNIFILKNGVKSIADINMIPSNQIIVTLPTAITNKLPVAKILGRVNYQVVLNYTAIKPVVRLSPEDELGNPVNGTVHYNGVLLGNTNTDVSITNLNCPGVRSTITKSHYDIDVRRVVREVRYCKTFRCGTINLIVRVNGYPDKIVAVKIDGKTCE
jgi:microsomal dipeptidase-like Zn-dependent dipeptidase